MVNDLGQIAGQSSSATGPRAVFWDNSTVPQELGLLAGSYSSFAVAISSDGRVIAGVSTDGNGTHPVRWLRSNGQWLIDALPHAGAESCSVSSILGVLPGYTRSIAYGLNNTGLAVGSSTSSNLTRATKWVVM